MQRAEKLEGSGGGTNWEASSCFLMMVCLSFVSFRKNGTELGGRIFYARDPVRIREFDVVSKCGRDTEQDPTPMGHGAHICTEITAH